MGDRDRVKDLDPAFVKTSLGRIRDMVADSFDQMKISAEDVPLIAVGGGAFLIPDKIAGASDVLRVENAGVANALGAAMAQVSGEVDQVFSGLSRDEALAKAEDGARDAAVASGASRASLKTLEVEDIPIAYLPGGARRVRVRVIGDIAFN
jgi:N-methylhydantoinase A/oxoprolinase/acetone carboxylase beta subunit